MEHQEEWREIAGYEGCYEVSNLGRVRSMDRTPANHRNIKKGRVLRSANNGKGYRNVYLSVGGTGRTQMIHRLVAAAFLPAVPGKMQVNHKDGNKANNLLENLEWVTPSENSLHSIHVLGNKVGFLIEGFERTSRGGGFAPGAPSPNRTPILQLSKSGEFIAEHESVTAAAEAVEGERSSISKCLRGISRKSKGFRWAYKYPDPQETSL